VIAPLAERRRYYRAALSFARLARRIGGRRIRAGFRTRLKADASVVTDVDLAIERALRSAIGRTFPRHGVLGEELPHTHPDAEYQWILDPIDGTTSLTNGIPFYGTIIALHQGERPLVGVIDLPALDRCYSAAVGLGAWRDGRRLRVRDAARGDLPREVISVGDRGRFVQCRAGVGFDRLIREHGQVRGYIDCIAHAFAAEGVIGAAVDYGVKLWDIAATQVLVEEAGGRYVCAYRSRGADPKVYGIICGKPAVVRWLERRYFGPQRTT
jgi:fructose-1,6-bisphosphatase/inositol monophosphatase family enzyme